VFKLFVSLSLTFSFFQGSSVLIEHDGGDGDEAGEHLLTRTNGKNGVGLLYQACEHLHRLGRGLVKDEGDGAVRKDRILLSLFSSSSGTSKH
jgi:hypothetical protein